ncbi:uncharacterized protein PG998_003856 [Apiospora kogelbergensis]|uniref:uncharacterized protein n=1 Tax=Apiospora kogelbergensis TaxID=1337665 RepID=UPI00312F5391
MVVYIFLFFALAITGLCRNPHTTNFEDQITVTTQTVAPYPPQSSSTSTVSLSPSLDDSTTSYLFGALLNERAANKAEKCKNTDQGSFVESAVKFLSNWKLDAGVAGQNNETAKQVLERLVHYQDLYAIIFPTQRARRGKSPLMFPENTVKEIRIMKSVLEEGGVLRGRNGRVIDALDVIFDDICTGNETVAQIPRSVQEMVGVVLRGIAAAV